MKYKRSFQANAAPAPVVIAPNRYDLNQPAPNQPAPPQNNRQNAKEREQKHGAGAAANIIRDVARAAAGGGAAAAGDAQPDSDNEDGQEIQQIAEERRMEAAVDEDPARRGGGGRGGPERKVQVRAIQNFGINLADLTNLIEPLPHVMECTNVWLLNPDERYVMHSNFYCF